LKVKAAKQTLQLPNKVLKLSKDEIPVITYWKKDGDEIFTYYIEGDEIVKTVKQPLSRIPVVRFFGHPTIINFEQTYRGVYVNVLSLLMKLDVENSIIYDSELTEPDFNYWRSEESIGNDASTIYQDQDGATKLFRTYREYIDPSQPALRATPPQRVEKHVDLPKLIAAAEYTKRTISEIVGNVFGKHSGGSKTAEEILLMKDAKDSAANTFIKNLLQGSHEVASLITDFTGQEVKITESIVSNLKKQDKLRKLFALIDYVSTKQEALTILPVLLKNMNLDNDEETFITNQFAIKGEANPALAQAQQTIQQLQQQLNETNASVEAQVAAAKIRQSTELTTTHQNNQIRLIELELRSREIAIKEAELGIKRDQTDNKMEIDTAKVMLSQDKAVAEQINKIDEVATNAVL
jgi:hypothetical protein